MACAERSGEGTHSRVSGWDESPAIRIVAVVILALLLASFWAGFRDSSIARPLQGHTASAFLSFALLLAPLWLFGFGAANALRTALARRGQRVAMASLCCLPYLCFSIPRHEFQWPLAVAMAGFPVLLAALLVYPAVEPHFSTPLRVTARVAGTPSWRDAVVLLALAAVLELRLLTPAWPYTGLGSLPKLYLADVALYLYLVVRGIDGMGYSFIPSGRTFLIAAREWAFFAPFGIGLGLALKFITFHPRLPSPMHAAAAVLVTFLLTAVPEELFFRGILQNLLETRLGRTGALVLTSMLFGLSHFHKGAAFNWRYVLLAAIAGIFYGRAWRAERKVLASAITHTAVDVVWSLWFR
ncbi:MAG: CPBP family intramembrane glutamic endopeptidase [Candidatus Korobacteraceae bacterium]|jgi:membrane protease YdiL (CAAX protease family)